MKTLPTNLWAASAALLLFGCGIIFAVLETTFNTTYFVSVWQQHPYLTGNILIAIAAIVYLYRGLAKNERDYEKGLVENDIIGKAGIFLCAFLIGGFGTGIYSIIVAMNR